MKNLGKLNFLHGFMQVALVFFLWFMKVWKWPAKPLVLFIFGWLQSAFGKEVFLWPKKQKSVYSICNNIDPRGAFEEIQSG